MVFDYGGVLSRLAQHEARKQSVAFCSMLWTPFLTRVANRSMANDEY